MHGAIGAEEQQNRVESILEHETEFEVEFHIEEEKSCRDQEPGLNGEEFT